MIGGRIQQVIERDDFDLIEVLDEKYFDRAWRWVQPKGLCKAGDHIWWQAFQGYLTRGNEFEDRKVDTCRPSDPPRRKQ